APLPAGVHGLGGQYGFYLAQLRAGAHGYPERTFPFQLAGAGQLKLLLTLAVYGATGLASFVALSLRKPLPAIVVFLAMLGFSLTVDGAGSVIVLPLAFLFLAGCLLALSLLGATPVAASKPWQDWSAWGPLGHSPSRLTFNWMLNFPSLLNPKTN